MPEGLTQFSLSNFLGHDPKDREYLHHDLNDDVRQSRRRPDLDILFKALEKAFHAAEQVNQSILASADILDGLGDVSSRTPARRVKKDAYLKEDANPSKYRTRWWKYLQNTSESTPRAA